METVDHYTVVREPGGEYETHVNPSSGTGFDIAAEMVTTVSVFVYEILWKDFEIEFLGVLKSIHMSVKNT